MTKDMLKEFETNTGLVGDEAIRELIWLATGRVIPADQPLQLSDYSIPITHSLINRLAVIGLAGVAHKARRGSEKASMYLVDRGMGTPEAPFKEQLNTLNLEEATALLKQELKGGLNINDALAGDIVSRLAQKDVEHNG